MDTIKYKDMITVANTVIRPALERVKRWYHPPEDDYQFVYQIDENVWEHTQACLELAEELIKKYPEILKFISFEDLQLTILFHDAPEGFAIHGDVSQYDPDKERKKLENDEDRIFQEKIIGELGIPANMYDLYQSYENKSSIEGLYCKID